MVKTHLLPLAPASLLQLPKVIHKLEQMDFEQAKRVAGDGICARQRVDRSLIVAV